MGWLLLNGCTINPDNVNYIKKDPDGLTLVVAFTSGDKLAVDYKTKAKCDARHKELNDTLNKMEKL